MRTLVASSAVIIGAVFMTFGALLSLPLSAGAQAAALDAGACRAFDAWEDSGFSPVFINLVLVPLDGTSLEETVQTAADGLRSRELSGMSEEQAIETLSGFYRDGCDGVSRGDSSTEEAEETPIPTPTKEPESDTDDEQQPEPTATAQPTATARATPTPRPTATPRPTPPPAASTDTADTSSSGTSTSGAGGDSSSTTSTTTLPQTGASDATVVLIVLGLTLMIVGAIFLGNNAERGRS